MLREIDWERELDVGSSLGVQWLRFCTLTAGSEGSIPDQRTRSHVPLGLAWPGGKRERELERDRLTRENNKNRERWSSGKDSTCQGGR